MVPLPMHFRPSKRDSTNVGLCLDHATTQLRATSALQSKRDFMGPFHVQNLWSPRKLSYSHLSIGNNTTVHHVSFGGWLRASYPTGIVA